MKMTNENNVSIDEIERLILQYADKEGALLSILEEVQELNEFKYLPANTLSFIAKEMKLPLTQVYSVVTFYSFFNLQPQGKNTIIVCRGTACHTKGSKVLLNDLYPTLGLKNDTLESEKTVTTSDNLFTIKTVACFGQCALAPVVSINGKIYSNVNINHLVQVINQLKLQNTAE